MHRIKFFLPFWWDHVYGDFECWEEKWTNRLENHIYAWEIFDEVPFDGVLFSRVEVEKSNSKYEKILDSGGIREFLNIPENISLFGDCGAFGYIEEDKPPYDPIETLNFYEKLQYDLACTVDHLIVKSTEDTKEERFNLVLDNAKKMIDEWNRKDFSYELVGVAQGWDPQSYREAIEELTDMGFGHIGLGGLARSNNKTISKILKTCYPAWKGKDVNLHIFGIGKWQLLPLMKKLGISSIDNAYHRRAWLSEKKNYEIGEDAYTAIRIPISHPYSDERIPEEEKVFEKLKAYERDRVPSEDVIESLERYEEKLVEMGKEDKNRFERMKDLENQYLRTLKERPWERCNCPICEEYGLHVCIFRRNERNMRRGFHNLYNFYKRFRKFQQGELEKNESMKKWSEPNYIQVINEEEFEGDKILVLTSCTAKKISNEPGPEAKAKEMYKGRIFQRVKNLCEAKDWDYKIISAKYGLIDPEEKIKGYNKVLKTQEDVDEIQTDALDDLLDILPSYDKIIVLAGKKYRKVIDPLLDYRFYVLKSQGYGDLCSKIKSATPPIERKLSEF